MGTMKHIGQVVVLVCILAMGLNGCSPIVFIPDPALKSVIQAELGKPLSLFLTQTDLAKITELNGSGYNIDSLEGLQFCNNLRKINLSDNRISSMGALAGLTKLTYLNLSGNEITDIEPVSGMLSLDYLNLGGSGNAIIDWRYLQDNVLNGGLKAGSVVVLPYVLTMSSTGNPYPSFLGAYTAMVDAGVILEFLND